MNALLRLQKAVRMGFLLIGAGISLLLVGVVAAQSQLPGLALTSDPSNDFRPTWSPDGNKIVFHSNRAGDNDIWAMDGDGRDQRQLTNGPADDRRPTWSPDGEWVAFDSNRGGSKDIWVVHVDGGDPLQVTNGSSIDNFPSWSPDGTQIAFYKYEGGVLDLWVVAVEDLLIGGEAGQPQRVTTQMADEKQQQCTYACHTPTWSPDSRQLAFGRSNHTEVWVVGVDGSDPYQVGAEEGQMHFPWWTTEGKLLMLSEHSTSGQQLVNDVWLMDADGSNPALLFVDIPHGGPFYWNPTDIEIIAFHSPRAGSFDIYTTKLGEEAPVISEPTPALGEATEEVMGEGAERATAVAQAPNPPAVETETETVRALPVLGLVVVLIGLAAAFVLGGFAVAIYLFYKKRT